MSFIKRSKHRFSPKQIKDINHVMQAKVSTIMINIIELKVLDTHNLTNISG